MSKSTAPVLPATAAVVRTWAQANPSLVPDEGRHTVTKDAQGRNPKGRIHPSVREAFNEANPRGGYTEGTAKPMPVTYKHVQPSGRKVNKTVVLPEAEVRNLAALKDSTVGARGPLSKRAMLAASEALAEALNS